jgi:hypothetical protein
MEWNVRDVRRIEADAKDVCRGCKQPFFEAGIERTTGAIKAVCVNDLCPRINRVVYLDKSRNIHHWPGEAAGVSPRTAERDCRFEVPFDRREYVYARDGETCQHCAKPLFEEISGPGEPPPLLASGGNPDQLSLLESQQKREVGSPMIGSTRGRPQRRKNPRAIDHICPRWIARRLLPVLDPREIALVGHIAVVASCPPCNGKRQIATDQLLSAPVANVAIGAMQRLFATRILIDADVDPVEDTARFTRVLRDVRNILVGRPIGRRTG